MSPSSIVIPMQQMVISTIIVGHPTDGQRKDDRSGKPATSEMKLVTRVTRTSNMETKSWRHIPVHALRSRTREAAKQRWRKKIRPASIDEQRDKEKWRKEEMNT